MTDEEQALTVPVKGLHPIVPPARLTPHPSAPARPCDVCGAQKTRAYRHPNPLRTNVVLSRCHLHCYVAQIVEDRKDAPGGGVYR